MVVGHLTTTRAAAMLGVFMASTIYLGSASPCFVNLQDVVKIKVLDENSEPVIRIWYCFARERKVQSKGSTIGSNTWHILAFSTPQ